MNLSELEQAFRIRVHDKAEPYFFSSEEVRSFANAAIDEAAIRSRCLRAVCTLDVAINDTVLDVPYELLWVHPSTIRFTVTATDATTPLMLLSDAEFASFNMYGAPTATTPQYLRIGEAANTVEMSPAASAVGTLSFTIARMPTETEQLVYASDEPAIPATLHRHLVSWMEYEAYTTPDTDTKNEQKASSALAMFESMFGRRISARAEQKGRQQTVGNEIYPRPFGG